MAFGRVRSSRSGARAARRHRVDGTRVAAAASGTVVDGGRRGEQCRAWAWPAVMAGRHTWEQRQGRAAAASGAACSVVTRCACLRSQARSRAGARRGRRGVRGEHMCMRACVRGQAEQGARAVAGCTARGGHAHGGERGKEKRRGRKRKWRKENGKNEKEKEKGRGRKRERGRCVGADRGERSRVADWRPSSAGWDSGEEKEGGNGRRKRNDRTLNELRCWDGRKILLRV